MKQKEQKIRVRYLQDMGDIQKGQELKMVVAEAYRFEKQGLVEILDIKESPMATKALTKKEEETLINLSFDNDKLKQILAKDELNDYDLIYCRTLLKKIKEAESDIDNIVPEENLKILKDPNLFDKITIDEMDKKIVKEIPTRKSIFLCSQGRLVENCQIASFNLLINDEAGAGKDYVTSKVLEINPSEIYIKKTRISPTVFTYWHNSHYEPEWTWDGKIFYTEDISESVLNSEVFKVMCSSGSQATIVVRQRAIDIDINGKPVIITTTANSIPNPELTRRFEIVNLDESVDQTKEIMKRHSLYAVKGISPEYNERIIKSLSYLKRVKVKIPYAELLTNLFPATNIMMRTKFPRFLDLIRASTAFHQYQRAIDEEGFYLSNDQDYKIATEVMQKLISNKYLISLTKNQRKIVEFIESMTDINPNYSESATKIRESMKNFISLPSMITNLSLLTGYGLLNVHIDEGQNGREIEKYQLSPHIKEGGDTIIFPDFKSLTKFSRGNEGSSKAT